MTFPTDAHQEALINFKPPQSPLPLTSNTTFTITTNEQDLDHTPKQEPKEAQPLPPSLKTHPKPTWVTQLEYEEQKCQQLLAHAQCKHEHHRMLKAAHDRMTRARDRATEHNIQWANDESSEDQLEAEWARINLMQISDDPWTETHWATFLNLNETHNCNPEQEWWYLANNELTLPTIHPEQAAKIKCKADQAHHNSNIEEVLSISNPTNTQMQE